MVFDKVLKIFWKILLVCYRATFHCYGMAKYGANNLAIWSHCRRGSMAIGDFNKSKYGGSGLKKFTLLESLFTSPSKLICLPF